MEEKTMKKRIAQLERLAEKYVGQARKHRDVGREKEAEQMDLAVKRTRAHIRDLRERGEVRLSNVRNR